MKLLNVVKVVLNEECVALFYDVGESSKITDVPICILKVYRKSKSDQ